MKEHKGEKKELKMHEVEIKGNLDLTDDQIQAMERNVDVGELLPVQQEFGFINSSHRKAPCTCDTNVAGHTDACRTAPVRDRFAGGHREVILMLAMCLHPTRYLEIGSADCFTPNLIAPCCTTLVGIDVDPRGYPTHDNIEIISVSSNRYFRRISPTTKFDLIFIDGDHSYVQVCKDFNNSIAHLTQNGVIAMHDSFPPDEEHKRLDLCGEVYMLVRELRENRHFEVFTVPITFGVTLVRRNEEMWPEKHIEEEA